MVEIEELEAMVASDGWRVYFRNILSEHRKHLIKRLNQSIERHDDRLVGEIYAKVREIENIFGLVTARVKQLNEELEQNQKEDK